MRPGFLVPVPWQCLATGSLTGYRFPSLQFFSLFYHVRSGRDSSVGIATRYGLNGPGIESRCGGEIFRNRPDRPWGPLNLLYNGYRVSFPGLKRPGRGVDHPPPSSAEVKERVELYLCSPSGPSWPVLGWTLLTMSERGSTQCFACLVTVEAWIEVLVVWYWSLSDSLSSVRCRD